MMAVEHGLNSVCQLGLRRSDHARRDLFQPYFQ
jgi:hypothetical protein